MKPHIELARAFWSDHLQPGDLAIDATLGNGHDALFLADLGCEVIGLDIQTEALEKARMRLGDKKIATFQLSHEMIGTLKVAKPPKLIVYNLGYLPGGDKSITTLKESTLKSVNESLRILDPKGALSITCYPGHPEGLEEEKAIGAWAAKLDPKRWNVCRYRWLNLHRGPSFLWVAAI